MEKIVEAELLRHIEINSTIPDIQSEFKKNHVTSTALMKVTNDITTSMDNCKVTLLILMDLSKAFDSVEQLSQYGLKSKALHWFTSYLSDRRQPVKMNGEFLTKEAYCKEVYLDLYYSTSTRQIFLVS
nr:unnamed protein product [Callosobruchus analis]